MRLLVGHRLCCCNDLAPLGDFRAHAGPLQHSDKAHDKAKGSHESDGIRKLLKSFGPVAGATAVPSSRGLHVRHKHQPGNS